MTDDSDVGRDGQVPYAEERAQAREDVLALHGAGRLRYNSQADEWYDDVDGWLSTTHLYAAEALADVLDLQQAGLLRYDEASTTWTVEVGGERLSLSKALQVAAATLARHQALGESGQHDLTALSNLRSGDLAALVERLGSEHRCREKWNVPVPGSETDDR